MNKEITGIMIYYYIVCKRKLWYFYHDIQMEQNNEDVLIGKVLDTETYKREKKHINIDNVINIDFIKSKRIIHEVKKSKKIEEASITQVKYYLYFLKKKGIDDIKGKIDYPLLKKSINVELNDEDEKYLEEIMSEIEKIVDKKRPPEMKRSKICSKCAYHDICFI